VCLSSPIGIESLAREPARELIEAYLDGALALGDPFGVWAPLALARPSADDVDSALERGCVGISLPAGALGGVDRLAQLAPVLERIQARGAPLFVHPGPGMRALAAEASLEDPLWWPALTRYVAEMQGAWLAWAAAGRRLFPELRVVFAMLAGLAPLHSERLRSRGGPDTDTDKVDPLVFYDTSSYGPRAVCLTEQLVGSQQLVYGSDRPVVDPDDHGVRETIDWELFAGNAARALPSEQPRRPAHAAIPRRRAQPRRVAVLERVGR
jgi:predicted TIM-barrel fold metal-dependent hydrolase